MKVKEVLTPLDLKDLILIINENTHSEHDCDRDTYVNHIIKNMYKNAQHRITLLYLDQEVIGYLIVRFDNFIKKEIVVVDIFIKKEQQGNQHMDALINDMIPKALKTGALRISWSSYIFDTDFWEKHSFGAEVKSYKIFYAEITNENKDIYNGVSK